MEDEISLRLRHGYMANVRASIINQICWIFPWGAFEKQIMQLEMGARHMRQGKGGTDTDAMQWPFVGDIVACPRTSPKPRNEATYLRYLSRSRMGRYGGLLLNLET